MNATNHDRLRFPLYQVAWAYARVSRRRIPKGVSAWCVYGATFLAGAWYGRHEPWSVS